MRENPSFTRKKPRGPESEYGQFLEKIVRCHLEAARRCKITITPEMQEKARTEVNRRIFGGGEKIRKMELYLSDASGIKNYTDFLEHQIRTKLAEQAQEQSAQKEKAEKSQPPEEIKASPAPSAKTAEKRLDWLTQVIQGTDDFIKTVAEAEGLGDLIMGTRRNMDRNL